MTATRGNNALFPCPVCLVPCDQRHVGGLWWARRDVDEVKCIVLNTTYTATAKEELLKRLGVRNVQVRMYMHCSMR